MFCIVAGSELMVIRSTVPVLGRVGCQDARPESCRHDSRRHGQTIRAHAMSSTTGSS